MKIWILSSSDYEESFCPSVYVEKPTVNVLLEDLDGDLNKAEITSLLRKGFFESDNTHYLLTEHEL